MDQSHQEIKRTHKHKIIAKGTCRALCFFSLYFLFSRNLVQDSRRCRVYMHVQLADRPNHTPTQEHTRDLVLILAGLVLH
jgi:hypothetical protein